VGAPAAPFDISDIPRSARRSMSRMSEMAVVAAKQATAGAGITFEKSDHKFRTCLIFGSTTGSPFSMEAHFKKFFERGGPEGQLSTSFFKVMNHSVASNVSVALEYLGPQLGISSACSTSSQAMVLAWELLHTGFYDVIVAGGADELHHMSAGVFDVVEAASRLYNDRPQLTPRPFDVARDGLVVSEGASVVVLETERHARARRAPILGWLRGGSYLCDGSHMSQPRQPSMVATMQLALDRAEANAGDVGYINAHATGTRLGDIEEAKAVAELFGSQTPVSSLKGHFGHSMAACGAAEAMMTLEMMRRGVIIPTRNLENIDPECAGARIIKKSEEDKPTMTLSNNFAFGGMNTALVLSLN
jgi:3-oxoacyl-[acyl-carrier-protein] synthase II